MLLGLIVIDQLMEQAGYDETIVTSMCDGRHSESSSHYEGEAVDVRTWHMKPEKRDWVLARARRHLGRDYDILLEAKTVNGNSRYAEHIHLEHDPKRD